MVFYFAKINIEGGEWLMSSNSLASEAIELRREYFRNWNKNNKQRKKEYNARYWQKKARIKRESKTNEQA